MFSWVSGTLSTTYHCKNTFGMYDSLRLACIAVVQYSMIIVFKQTLV